MLPGAIALVAQRLVGADGLDVRPQLRGAAPGALLRAGGEEHLQLGVGGHDRPDVTTLRHPVARLKELALAVHQCGAHRRVRCHPGSGLRHLGRSDVRTGQQVDVETGRLLGRRTAAAQRLQGDGAVHRPGIEIGEAERACKSLRNRALARAGGTVDGHDHGGQG